MLIEARPTLRLALGLAIAGVIGWGQGGPFAYMLPMLALLLLAGGGPPPKPGEAVALLVIVALSCLWGLLLVPVLHHVPVAGVLLILAGVAASAFLAARQPALTVPLRLFIVGDTLIACLAYQSQAAALLVAMQLVMDIALAAAIASGLALLLPDRGAAIAPPPAPLPLDQDQARWIALRAALVMVAPVILALDNPGLFIMTLMNAAILAQQPNALTVRENGRAIATSTLAGGVLALLLWMVLRLWPGLALLVGLVALAGLLAGPRLHGPAATPAGMAWWLPTLSTMIVVLGNGVADSATGDDISLLMVRRVVVMVVLAGVAALLVEMLDTLQNSRRLRPAQKGE